MSDDFDEDAAMAQMAYEAEHAAAMQDEENRAIAEAENARIAACAPQLLQVELGAMLFAFTSETQWVNKAKSWYATCGVATCDTVAIDARGRICSRGKHFMRADAENTYPITVYALDDDPMPRAQPQGRP